MGRGAPLTQLRAHLPERGASREDPAGRGGDGGVSVSSCGGEVSWQSQVVPDPPALEERVSGEAQPRPQRARTLNTNVSASSEGPCRALWAPQGTILAITGPEGRPHKPSHSQPPS